MAIINDNPITTTILSEIIQTTTTTTTTPIITTTDFPLYADFIAAPASSMSSSAAEDLIEQAHNQITFEIPSEHDMKHIDALHTFNTLLKRIGNMAYDTMAMNAGNRDLSQQQQQQQPIHVSANQIITTEQIAKSVVLDLAEVNENDSPAEQFMERMFAGSDINEVINYLWIGVVTALVILSVIFIVFSCYFYRKFREWKKCNKDIRSQLTGGDLYTASSISTRARTCDQRLLNVRGQANGGGGSDGGSTESTTGFNSEAAFYQIESPPCYTIATGLPTYDEALHHQNQHYSFGMKCIYPSLAAVHQHSIVSNWEKDELTLEQRKVAKHVQSAESQTSKLTLNIAMEDTPPAYADAAAAASVALLSDDVTKLQNICINIEDMTTTTTAATTTTTTMTVATEIPAASRNSSKSLQDNNDDNDDSCSIVVIAA